MNRRLVGICIVAVLIISIFIPSSTSFNEIPLWDENWKYKQEIHIPIDTNLDHAKYQPIDIRIEFNNTCWAKDETHHSIRICYWDGYSWYPIDSQIYDLVFSDDEYIKSCSLVFLIPPEVNGEEKYYVHYDDEKKSSPNYTDHVEIIPDCYYEYNKIPGMTIKSKYYKIMQDGDIIYAIAYEGKSLGYIDNTCHQITKLKPNAKDTTPKNGDQLVSFPFVYWYKQWNKETKEYQWMSPPIGAVNLEHKDILVDGNLMVKFRIISKSSEGRIKTSATYKYYYSPTENKRIQAHIKNEVIKHPFPEAIEIDVSYVVLSCGGCKSSGIPDLNFGGILPYFHLYNEDELVREYPVNTHPEGGHIFDVHKSDDVDLGSRAWLSVDEGATGKAHAIIFNTTKIMTSGTDEKQGIEIQHFEGETSITGLELVTSDYYIGRNAYEKNDTGDEDLPSDLVVEFIVEFFTTETGGHKTVEEEAGIFQSLVNYQPTYDEVVNYNETDPEDEEETYSLTTYVHFAPSFPFGSLLSFMGYNYSYLTMDLYHEEGSLNQLNIERLSVNSTDPVSEIDFSKPLKDVGTIIREWSDIFDTKNRTFFKKAHFNDLKPGRYLAKVYRENSRLKDERQFIGYEIIELKEDTTIRIYCSVQGNLDIRFIDQHENSLENVDVCLLKEDIIISEDVSKSDGTSHLNAPCSFSEEHKLKVMYDGFHVNKLDKQIQLGLKTWFKSLEETLQLDVHDLTIKIKGSDGKSPESKAVITLTSDKMEEPVTLSPDEISNDEYKFLNLYPSEYKMSVIYKSFELEKTIKVPDTNIYIINLYDLVINIKDDLGFSPGVKLDVVLNSDDFIKPIVTVGKEQSSGKYVFKELLEGDYTVKIFYKTFKKEENIRIPISDSGSVKEIVFPAVFDVELTFFDVRGNRIEDGTIFIKRDGKDILEKEIRNGNVSFLVPPGTYSYKLYSEENLISEQKIDIIGNKQCNVLTTLEPIYPLLLIILTLVGFLVAGCFSIWKKDRNSFLKIIAITLAVIALVMPWWMIQGSVSSLSYDTSTNTYLIPAKMVTITTGPNVIGGELASLPDIFIQLLDFLPLLIILGCICISLSIIWQITGKKRRSMTSQLAGGVILATVLSLFTFAMNRLASVGIGSFIGNSNLEFIIPGQGIYETFSCNWGPTIGYILCLLSTVIVFCVFIYNLKKYLSQRTKKIQLKFDMKHLIKYFKKVMPFIGIFLLIYLIWNTGTEEIINTFLKISPIYIVLAAVLTLPRVLLRNIQWQFLLRKQNISIGYLSLIKIFLIGYFYGMVTPGYWGLWMRAPYLKEKTGEPMGKLFISCFLHSAINTLPLYFMAVIGALVISAQKLPKDFPIKSDLIPVIAGVALCFQLLFYAFFIKKERGMKFFNILVKLTMAKKLQSFFGKLTNTFYNDFPSLKDFIIPLGLAIPGWLIMYSQIYILGLPLGIDKIPFLHFFCIYAIANIIAFIPITSAGLGTREATLVVLFGIYGVNPEVAIVLGIAGHLVTDVLTGLYGLVLAMVETRNNKKDTSEIKEFLSQSGV